MGEGRHLLAYLGEAYVLAGRLEEAWPVARRAIEFARERSERSHEAWATRLLGEIAHARGPGGFDEAETHYRHAMALAAERGMQPLVAHCRLELGTLLERRGRRPEARDELSRAIELYRAMNMGLWRDRAAAMLTGTT